MMKSFLVRLLVLLRIYYWNDELFVVIRSLHKSVYCEAVYAESPLIKVRRFFNGYVERERNGEMYCLLGRS